MAEGKSKVVLLPCDTTLPLPPNRILEGAMDKLSDVVVIGYEKDAGKLWVAASRGDVAFVNWLLDQGKDFLMHRMGED
jgi:hypothetical protein